MTVTAVPCSRSDMDSTTSATTRSVSSTPAPTPAPTTRPTAAAPPPPAATRPAPADLVVAVATIVGPLLLLASSVAWLADAGELQAILLMWAMIGLGLSIVGFSQRLRAAQPWAAAIVLGIGIIGTAAGAGYAVEAAIVDHFGIERMNDQDTLATLFVLQIPGILFPLSLVAAAVASWRARLLTPIHAGLIAVGALMFPASRIPEIAGLAVTADAVLCLGLVTLGVALLTGHPRTNAEG